MAADGTPYLFWEGRWSPICGHQFWDNQEGVKAFCKELGLTGGTAAKSTILGVVIPYMVIVDEDPIRIGKCNAGDAIGSCTGGTNTYERIFACRKNVPKISCEGNTPRSEKLSCLGKIN